MELITTFAPHADESALGYYRRLASDNALSSWKELARLCEVSTAKSALFARHEHVATGLGLEVDWSKQASKHDDTARGWRGLRRASSDAVCPHCLSESVYLRMGWEHAYMVACPHHEVLLCDACSACGLRLTSNRERIEYCPCGHDLRSNSSSRATDAQLWLAALIQSGGASSAKWIPLVEGINIDLVSMLVRALCLYFDPGVLPRRQNTAPPKTVKESLEFLQPLEKLLADWPLGFENHVSERIAAGPPDARTLNMLLGPWYAQLRAFAGNEPLEPFLAAIGRVATAEFDGILGLDEATATITKNSDVVLLTQAAKRIGVSRDTLLTQMKSGNLVHRTKLFGTRGLAYEIPVNEIEAVVAARTGWLSEKVACEMLGVPHSVMQRLVEAGLLVHVPDWRTDLRKGGPVERLSVMGLISTLRSHAPKPSQDEGRRISLRDFNSRRAGDKKALAAALRAIAAGEIRPVSAGAHVGDFEYPVGSVTQHFSTPVLDAGLSVQALSKMTGWKWESISHWIDLGLLESHNIVLRGQPCRVVLPAQLLAFCRTYIPLADLAAKLKSKSSALMERMQGVDVLGSKPLPSGQRRGGLVRIGDLARMALTKTPNAA